MAMTSRLYTAYSSSSDSEDSDVPKKIQNQRFKMPQSDSEDEKRVVRSAKDKRNEEMTNLLRNLNNHKKIKDMPKVEMTFDEIIKLYEKGVKLNEIEKYPTYYIRMLAQMEDFVNESWNDKKSLNKSSAKSLTILRQKIRKYLKDFEEPIKKYRENPDVESEVEEEAIPVKSGSSDSEEEVQTKSKTKASERKFSSGSEASSDESDDFFTSTDDSDDDGGLSLHQMENPADYFLKSTVIKTTKEKREKKETKQKHSRQVAKHSSEESDFEAVDGAAFEPAVQAFEKGVEITEGLVIKKVEEILSNRGKRTCSISEQNQLLDQVCKIIEEMNFNDGIHAKAILSLITVIFDYETKNLSSMAASEFQRTVELAQKLFDIINKNKSIVISEEITEETESVTVAPYRVRGSPLSIICRLDDEYFKILQSSNGHEVEYDERLREEPKMCQLIDQLLEYLKRTGAPSEAICKASLRKLEHMYYKFDYEWGKKVEQEGREAAGPNSHNKEVEDLCIYIYKHDTTDRMRTRAILCHIYYLALHDEWHRARELMLMSNLQATIDHADAATMVLFNRAMVQLGMCAFRQGHIREAHGALCDMVGTGRLRELLGQGQRFDRAQEDEKRDKALQMPYHMHINTELIETEFFICGMFTEIPALAASQDNENRLRVFSKAYMTALRIYERSPMTVPPESPRDHVLAASKALRHGDWRKATALVFSPKMEAKIWVLFYNSSAVKKMVEERIKEESLRCYLFTYAHVHESISLQRLAEHFEFPRSTVYSIISKMIINQELAGSLEVPADFLTIHKGERSRFQVLNIQLAEKITSIIEMNEKLFDNRGGPSSGNKGGQNYQGQRRQRFVQASKFN